MRDWRAEVRRRLGTLGMDPARETSIVEEVAQDLEDRYRVLLASGQSAVDATRELLADLDDGGLAEAVGRLPRSKAAAPVLGAGPGHLVGDGWHDARHALRMLRRNPLFTSAAVLTLALGIGTTTAMFSVVNAVLFRPLPFPQPERLVTINASFPDAGWTTSLSHANFWDLRDLNETFADVGAFTGRSLNLSGRELPERLSGAEVSVGFFRALAVTPVAGRLFAPGEDEPGHDVVLLSHRVWTSRFGGDTDLVGRTLTLDGRPHTVVGVLPPGTPWLDSADAFVPLVRQPDPQRGSFELAAIGRMRPGVSAERATADLERVARVLRGRFPEINDGFHLAMTSSRDWVASETQRRALLILMGAVGLLLLIASVNLVNLLLAQAVGRTREVALRAALGASRTRVIRQLVVESLLLGGVGAALGFLVVFPILAVLRQADTGLARVAFVEVDVRVLLFTVLVGLGTSVATGLVSALQAAAGALAPSLREGERGAVGSPRQQRIRQILVGTEVALSLTLLVGAGLLLRSFDAMMRVDRGFQTERRMLVQVNPPSSYDEARTWQLIDQMIERARTLPGLISIAAVSGRPLVPGSTGLGIGRPGSTDAGRDVPWATWRLVTPDYFRTMGVSLMRGRIFTDVDQMERDPMKAVVSQRVAELLYPGEDPVGRAIVLWKGQGDGRGEIIGVVDDIRERGLSEEPTLAVYFPYRGWRWLPVQFVLHTSAEAAALVPALRAVLSSIDRDVPLSDVQTLEEIVTRSVASRRFTLTLLGGFAGLAMVLALVGIHGVLAYSVARRQTEIGVRMALGATGGNVLRLIVWQGMRPVMAGLAVGLAAAFLLSQLMTSLLFDVTPTDPTTYGGVAVLIAVAAVLACVLPARKALRVNVMSALRNE